MVSLTDRGGSKVSTIFVVLKRQFMVWKQSSMTIFEKHPVCWSSRWANIAYKTTWEPSNMYQTHIATLEDNTKTMIRTEKKTLFHESTDNFSIDTALDSGCTCIYAFPGSNSVTFLSCRTVVFAKSVLVTISWFIKTYWVELAFRLPSNLYSRHKSHKAGSYDALQAQSEWVAYSRKRKLHSLTLHKSINFYLKHSCRNFYWQAPKRRLPLKEKLLLWSKSSRVQHSCGWVNSDSTLPFTWRFS